MCKTFFLCQVFYLKSSLPHFWQKVKFSIVDQNMKTTTDSKPFYSLYYKFFWLPLRQKHWAIFHTLLVYCPKCIASPMLLIWLLNFGLNSTKYFVERLFGTNVTKTLNSDDLQSNLTLDEPIAWSHYSQLPFQISTQTFLSSSQCYCLFWRQRWLGSKCLNILYWHFSCFNNQIVLMHISSNQIYQSYDLYHNHSYNVRNLGENLNLFLLYSIHCYEYIILFNKFHLKLKFEKLLFIILDINIK